MHNETNRSSGEDEDPTPEELTPEEPAEDEQAAADSGQTHVSLRAAMEAGQSIESLNLPPATVEALAQMQRNWATIMAPFVENHRRLTQNLAYSQALLPMAEAVKAVSIPPAQWANFAALGSQMAAAYAPFFEMTRQFQQQLVASRLQETLAQLGNLAALAGTSALPQSYCPANWEAHTWASGDIQAAMAILSDEGIPLSWVPRAQIVTDLVHAPDAPARHAILAARIPEIITDCGAVLDDIADPDLKSLVELSREALTALAVSPAAAQALAANIIDTFLRDANRRGRMFGGNFGFFKTDKVIKRITSVSGATPVHEFRVACVLTPMILALKSFDPENDPMPTEFGRHSTVHRADPSHYTSANGAIAVMLAVSFLREAQHSGW
jgi:hypothetical protein